MKKIFSICLILVVAVGFVACSDNDDAGNSYLQENTIKVIASNLTFSPPGTDGRCEVYGACRLYGEH